MECQREKYKKQIVPDPTRYELPEDFIFVEHEWGSLFYKHFGKQTRLAAKDLCSNISPKVHLPIPRFQEENEFYRTHFGDEGLWLDISYDVNEGLKSADGHLFIKYVRSFVTDKYNDSFVTEYDTFDYSNWKDSHIGYDHDVSYLLSLLEGRFSIQPHRKKDVIAEEFIEVKHHDWINLIDPIDVSGYFIDEGEKRVHMTKKNEWEKYEWEKFVFMTNTGEWKWINENEASIVVDEYGDRIGIYGNEEYDTVCVYNIIPEECSECSEESFCRYTNSETECDCQKMTKGEYCEIDSCSHCQNGGFCKKNNNPPDDTNLGHDEIKCICPYPFHGDYCEGANIIYIRSSIRYIISESSTF